MTVYAMPFLLDVKTKSSGVGGFTDGGCKCLRRDLTGQNLAALSVDVGPGPGKAWRSIILAPTAGASGSVCVMNKGTVPVDVTESFVNEDGTVIGTGAVSTIPGGSIEDIANAGGSSVFAGQTVGGTISYPNKLRYTLAPTNSTSTHDAPNGRVMLMLLVMEFDLAKDE